MTYNLRNFIVSLLNESRSILNGLFENEKQRKKCVAIDILGLQQLFHNWPHMVSILQFSIQE